MVALKVSPQGQVSIDVHVLSSQGQASIDVLSTFRVVYLQGCG